MAKELKPGRPAPASRSAQRRQATKPVQQTKKQIAHGRKQARQSRIIWLSVAALGTVLLVIVVLAIVRELVLAPAEPVATVNGVKIRADEYQDLLQYRRYALRRNQRDLEEGLQTLDPNEESNQFIISFYQQQLTQVTTALGTVTESTLDEIIDDQLIREKALELGITVTKAELDQRIDADVRQAMAPPTQEPITATTPALTPTPIPQSAVDEYFQAVLDDMQMSDETFRTILDRDLYRIKLEEYLAGQVMTTGFVINVRLVQTNTLEAATAARERIAAGESLADVAQEISSDTQTAESGGETGWVTPDQLTTRYGEPFATMVTTATLGTVDQVESNGLFYVFEVLDRDENGPLPEEAITDRRNSALQDWLDERRVAPDVKIERLLEPDQIPPDPFVIP